MFPLFRPISVHIHIFTFYQINVFAVTRAIKERKSERREIKTIAKQLKEITPWQ